MRGDVIETAISERFSDIIASRSKINNLEEEECVGFNSIRNILPPFSTMVRFNTFKGLRKFY